MSVTAVVLAGSRPGGDPLAAGFGEELKALIPVAGKPMLRWPVEALLASPAIDRVIIVAQQPHRLHQALPDDKRIELRKSEATIAATISDMVSSEDASFPLLVTTADHALLTPEMVAEFVTKADGVDLAIGVVEERLMFAQFPKAKRTWIAFRGGRYSGANLFLLGSRRVTAAIDQWRTVEQDRKKGWRLLAALGPALLAGAVLKLRTIDQSAVGVGRKLGLSIRAVQLSDPLAAVDVDKPEDHALAEALLRERA